MTALQLDLLETMLSLPEGLQYRRSLLSSAEEAALFA